MTASTALQLATADLVAPVRRCLGSDTASPASWTVEELSGSFGNPATRGVFRVRGLADDVGGAVPWRMVVKVHCDPRGVGKEFLGSDPRHWNYWLRELDLVTSSFFDDLPASFSVPASYGADDRANGQVWIWAEDVTDAGAAWDRARYLDVAHRVGQFNGSYLTGTPLPTNASLCRDFVGSWADTFHTIYPYLTDRDDRRWFWQHPVVTALLGAAKNNPLLAFADALDRHRAVLDQLPRTLCHRDLWQTNILWPTSERCVVIDWGIVGPGPVGEDLAQLSWSAHDLGITSQLADAYVAGLRGSGWTGEEVLVRYAHAASVAVRHGFLLLGLLHGGPAGLRRISSGRAAAARITADALEGFTDLAAVAVEAATTAMAMVDEVAHHLAG